MGQGQVQAQGQAQAQAQEDFKELWAWHAQGPLLLPCPPCELPYRSFTPAWRVMAVH